jgi:hypothetical protein
LRFTSLPLVGILVTWSVYAGFCAFRHGSTAPLPVPSPAQVAPLPERVSQPVGGSEVKTSTPVGEAGNASTDDEEANPEGKASDPAEGPAITLTEEDREFLEAIERATSGGKDVEIDELRQFVVEYPEHLVSRGLLTMLLISREDTDPAELRAHVAALQKLAPELGLPDLLLASIEAREGNQAAAASLLARGVEKDLSWIPDFEVSRLKIAREFERGTPSIRAIQSVFTTPAPSGLALRNLARDFLPSTRSPSERQEGEPAPKGDPDAARAILRLGQSLQTGKGFLIHNLVGSSIVGGSLRELQACGEPVSNDATLENRTKGIQCLSRVVANDVDQLLLARPEVVPAFLRDFAEHGEAVAARRAMITYLTSELAR